MREHFQKGASLRLIEKPDGYLSQHAPVTVGKVYKMVDWMGSCVIVTTDNPDVTTSLYWKRFEPIVEVAPA